jgi:hypothetical protein
MYFDEGQTKPWPKEKKKNGKTMIYKTLHRKLRIGQDAFHEYRE